MGIKSHLKQGIGSIKGAKYDKKNLVTDVGGKAFEEWEESILWNESLSDAFMKYLIKSRCTENFVCWILCKTIKQGILENKDCTNQILDLLFKFIKNKNIDINIPCREQYYDDMVTALIGLLGDGTKISTAVDSIQIELQRNIMDPWSRFIHVEEYKKFFYKVQPRGESAKAFFGSFERLNRLYKKYSVK